MNSKKSIKTKNGGQSTSDLDQVDHEEDDLINADEFEEIAEIYDSIRVLHSKIDPQRDTLLAQDFDYKLRQVMEELAEAVKSSDLSRIIK